jgi:hypothetical protein
MKQDSRSKVVKSVGKKTFEIAMMQRHTGEYYIEWTLGVNGLPGIIQSSDLLDYNLASDVFEKRLMILEGN